MWICYTDKFWFDFFSFEKEGKEEGEGKEEDDEKDYEKYNERYETRDDEDLWNEMEQQLQSDRYSSYFSCSM